MTTFHIIAAAALLLAVALLAAYNRLVRLRNKVNEAFATMDVFLKKRSDLIPSLVEVVKGYARHESDVLERIAHERTNAVGQGNRGGQLAGEAGISGALRQVFAVAEAYPDLKANRNFLDLQQQLAKMEDEIALSRRYYNGSVREYNNHCQLFPLNLVASLFGFRAMPMFAVDSDAERQAVSVNL